MRPLIIANWKMNPPSRHHARGLFRKIQRGVSGARGVEIAIAPPFPYLALFHSGRTTALAAQDVFGETAGAYTGEVSAAMLRDLGVRYVIIGHSERRRVFGESDEMVNGKVRSALAAGLTPVIAVGEDLLDSEAVVPSVISSQLAKAIHGLPRRRLRNMVVAYEPVWAIGTARAATPDAATRRAIYIRKLLTAKLGSRIADTVRIIYGGSVTAKNAAAFLADDIRGMEGLLVGGASLNAEEFIAIVRAVAGQKSTRGYEIRK